MPTVEETLFHFVLLAIVLIVGMNMVTEDEMTALAKVVAKTHLYT